MKNEKEIAYIIEDKESGLFIVFSCKGKDKGGVMVSDKDMDTAISLFIDAQNIANAVRTLYQFHKASLNHDGVTFAKSSVGGFVGSIPKIEGVMSQGETVEELFDNLKDAKEVISKAKEEIGKVSNSTPLENLIPSKSRELKSKMGYFHEFSLSEKEAKAYKDSGSNEIKFTQGSGIGTNVYVKIKGKWKDITDYGSW